MSDGSPPETPRSGFGGRRASFSPGQSLSELFGRSASIAVPPGQTGTHPVAAAGATARQQAGRRMSLTATLGLTGTSPTQPSPFGAFGRRPSISSSNGASIDEEAVEDGDATSTSLPSSPFARRMSFGARALRDVKTGTSPGAVNSSNEGFNFSDRMRARAESAVGQTTNPFSGGSLREKPQAVPAMPQAPKAPPKRKGPDAFQERILKGDFYMD